MYRSNRWWCCSGLDWSPIGATGCNELFLPYYTTCACIIIHFVYYLPCIMAVWAAWIGIIFLNSWSLDFEVNFEECKFLLVYCVANYLHHLWNQTKHGTQICLWYWVLLWQEWQVCSEDFFFEIQHLQYGFVCVLSSLPCPEFKHCYLSTCES